jgi:hypothetical protein
MNILFVPTIALPGTVLDVFVRSDVNVVFPVLDCELGDGGIATLVTIFSVPSAAANINHIHTASKIYKAYLTLILTYKAKTRALTKRNKNKIQVTGMTFLRMRKKQEGIQLD